MHQNFTYTDLADRYLKEKLSEDERLAFEEKMQQDPLLASEMNLQRDIYHALGETRKRALKNRLDQVPVHHAPWTSWPGVRTAAAIGTLLLVGVGYYYVASPAESTEAVVAPVSSVRPTIYSTTYALDHTPVRAAPKVDVSAITKATNPPVATPSAEAPRTPARTTPAIIRPDVVSEFDEDVSSVDYHDFNVPEKQSLQGSAYQEEDVTIEARSDSDYDFHYQFYDNKLYLHGDFHSAPYKIIALNTETDKKLFLEFNHAYYRIGEHQRAVPLIKIEDSSLIKSLKSLNRVD